MFVEFVGRLRTSQRFWHWKCWRKILKCWFRRRNFEGRTSVLVTSILLRAQTHDSEGAGRLVSSIGLRCSLCSPCRARLDLVYFTSLVSDAKQCVIKFEIPKAVFEHLNHQNVIYLQWMRNWIKTEKNDFLISQKYFDFWVELIPSAEDDQVFLEYKKRRSRIFRNEPDFVYSAPIWSL